MSPSSPASALLHRYRAVRQATEFATAAMGATTGAAAGTTAANAKANLPARLKIKRAVAKTITFRIIVTTLDFTSNLIVIGELGTAAGLSSFALVVGPLFYLAHEGAWNYLGPPGDTVRISITGLGELVIFGAPALRESVEHRA